MEQDMKGWIRCNGKNTHKYNHDLNENSIVIELGGYTESWAASIKKECYVYVLEPIEKFYNILKHKYLSRKKMEILNFGISVEEKVSFIDKKKLNGNATRLLNLSEKNDSGEKIHFITLEKLMEINNINKIDLMQINIEGGEYDILENWIESGLINKIRTLQIQFHHFEGIVNPMERRKNIQKNLGNLGYNLKYKFDWVWECWEKN